MANAQTIVRRLAHVNDSLGGRSDTLSVSMAVLLGDTNGDRFTNSGDALQTRNRSGQTIDGTNFRSDVNTDGAINSGDTTIVRGRSGDSIP